MTGDLVHAEEKNVDLVLAEDLVSCSREEPDHCRLFELSGFSGDMEERVKLHFCILKTAEESSATDCCFDFLNGGLPHC